MKKIIPQNFSVGKAERNKLNGHKSFVVWFTGLSGSGKSTLANQVEKKLHDNGINTYSLDGDNIRLGLNHDLGFSEDDRYENLRRIAEVARLFIDSGTIVIASFISPLIKDREMIKNIIGNEDFVEIFVNTSLEECERRDVKGLYKKARAGEIKNFTGVTSPYEPPHDPDILIKTEEVSFKDAVERICYFLNKKLY